MTSTDVISPELEAACASLSPLYVDFTKRAARDRCCLRSEGYKFRTLPYYLGEEDTVIQRWPLLISRARHAELGQIAARLLDLLRRALPIAFEGNWTRTRNYLRLPPEQPLQTLFTAGSAAAGLAACVARGDFVLTTTGPKLIEFNLGPGIGGWEVYLLEQQFRTDPELGWLFADPAVPLAAINPFRLLVGHALQVGRAQQGARLAPGQPLTVGIAVPPALLPAARTLLESIRAAIAAGGGTPNRMICFSKQSVCIHRDGVLIVEDQPLHVVIDMDNESELQVGMEAASVAGDVVLLNGPAATLLNNKAILALLWDMAERGDLAPDDRELVETYIPWTSRVVEGEALRFEGEPGPVRAMLLRHQDKLVLKPADSRCGIGVTIGCRASPETWEAGVNQAIADERFVVQAHCASQRFPAPVKGRLEPQDLILGIFVFGQAFSGSYARMMVSSHPTGVVNCYQGAADAIVFQHD